MENESVKNYLHDLVNKIGLERQILDQVTADAKISLSDGSEKNIDEKKILLKIIDNAIEFYETQFNDLKDIDLENIPQEIADNLKKLKNVKKDVEDMSSMEQNSFSIDS